MPQTTQYIIDDQKWEELLELTNGAASVCFQCGVCTAICPWGLVKEETFSVRKYMRQAQLGLGNGNEGLWLCTTCAQCEGYCPRGVNIADVFLGLRYLSWERRNAPNGLPNMLWSIFWNNNPWDQPPSQRTQWAKNLSIPFFDSTEHEILYYVGCTASYDTRAQKIAQSLIHIFDAAGVKFGSLGEDEPCSGEEALSVGHKPYFYDIAKNNARTFIDHNISKLVTTSPHSYDAIKNHYSSDLNTLHYTHFLAELIEDKRLLFSKPVDHIVTYHDPCYLARHNNDTEASRIILNSIPGIKIVEMKNTGAETLCCGGGGGRMWLETKAGERFSDLRVAEALDVDAGIIATACPYCIACLEDSVKAKGIKNLVVMDIAEIAEQAI